MASSTTDTGDSKQNTCSICLERFKQPKLLPCFHTFCEHCLDEFVSKKSVKGTFNCPVCRHNVTLPDSGVKGFQTNFYIEADQVKLDNGGAVCDICPKTAVNRCPQCEQNLCEQCTGFHSSLKASQSHSLIRLQVASKDYPAITKPEFCSKHKGELFRFYCKQCSKPICRDCKLTSHEGHRTVDLEDVIEDGRRQLAETKVRMETLIVAFGQQRTTLSKNMVAFKHTLETLTKEVNDKADSMIAEINDARNSSVKELEMIKKTEESCFETTETVLAQEGNFVSSHTSRISTLLDEGCGADILSAVPEMKQRYKELTEAPVDKLVKNTSKEYVRASRNTFHVNAISQIIMPMREAENAKVVATFQCDTGRSTIDFISPIKGKRAWVGIRRKHGKCTVAVFNHKGKVGKSFHLSKERYEGCRKHGILSFLTDHDGSEDSDSGLRDEICLKQKPHSDTRHGFTATVNILQKTVTVVDAKDNKVLDMSSLPISSSTNIFTPVDVSIMESGNLIIVDKGSNSLLIYNMDSASLRRIVLKNDGQFSPIAVAVSHTGLVWVGEESGRMSLAKL